MKFRFEYEKIEVFDTKKAWLFGSWSWEQVYGSQYGLRLFGTSAILTIKKK